MKATKSLMLNLMYLHNRDCPVALVEGMFSCYCIVLHQDTLEVKNVKDIIFVDSILPFRCVAKDS